MLYTLEGYDNNLGFSLKKSVKKVAKKATAITHSPVVETVKKIATNPAVIQASIAAAGTAVGIPPQASLAVMQTVQQGKATIEEIKKDPVIKEAIKEIAEQKGDKIITNAEIDKFIEVTEKVQKDIVKKVAEQLSIAFEYYKKGELI